MLILCDGQDSTSQCFQNRVLSYRLSSLLTTLAVLLFPTEGMSPFEQTKGWYLPSPHSWRSTGLGSLAHLFLQAAAALEVVLRFIVPLIEVEKTRLDWRNGAPCIDVEAVGVVQDVCLNAKLQAIKSWVRDDLRWRTRNGDSYLNSTISSILIRATGVWIKHNRLHQQNGSSHAWLLLWLAGCHWQWQPQ